jgi:hypothetical protein
VTTNAAAVARMARPTAAPICWGGGEQGPGRDLGQPQLARGHAGQPGQQHPLQVQPGQQPPGAEGGGHHHGQGGRDQGQAGFDRAETLHLLQVQRDEVHVAGQDRAHHQHGHDGRPPGRGGENGQGQHGGARVSFDKYKSDHEQDGGDERGQRGGGAEAVLLAVAEAVDQGRDRRGDQQRTGDVDAAGLGVGVARLGGVPAAGRELREQGQHQRDQRRIDQEHRPRSVSLNDRYRSMVRLSAP